MAYVGNTLDELTESTKSKFRQFNILRRARKVHQIEGKKITTNRVLQAFAALHAENDNKLGSMAPIMSLEAADWSTSNYASCQIFCEDQHMSLGAVGFPYLALAVDCATTPVLNAETLQKWIAFCAFFWHLADV